MDINLKIDKANISKSFERIAEDLMNNWILVSQTNSYRIAEIEFYFNCKGVHEDPYTHSHEIQKQSGKWYLHGSGIDITFGEKDCYGGILIRALQDLNNPSNYVYGPIVCLTELFKNFGSVYKSEFTFGLEKDLERKIEFEKPIAATRVGLNQKHNKDMHRKFYRFLVLPKKKHAEKTQIVECMAAQGYSSKEIKAIWG